VFQVARRKSQAPLGRKRNGVAEHARKVILACGCLFPTRNLFFRHTQSVAPLRLRFKRSKEAAFEAGGTHFYGRPICGEAVLNVRMVEDTLIEWGGTFSRFAPDSSDLRCKRDGGQSVDKPCANSSNRPVRTRNNFWMDREKLKDQIIAERSAALGQAPEVESG
jgi:hypothetical protein